LLKNTWKRLGFWQASITWPFGWGVWHPNHYDNNPLTKDLSIDSVVRII
jgi:hypothetical protein